MWWCFHEVIVGLPIRRLKSIDSIDGMGLLLFDCEFEFDYIAFEDNFIENIALCDS